jgi:hypothetical protein
MPKGHTNNPNGRPKGAKSKKTVEWEALGEAITTRHADRFNKILKDLPDDKFADKFLQVLEYFKPKQARVENVHQGDVSINIKEVKTYADNKADKEADAGD